MIPLELVDAQPAQSPRYGLLASAPIVGDGIRWQGGFQWEPETCAPGDAGPADCAPLEREPSRTSSREHSHPFLVWAIDSCSTLGFFGRDWQGRARRALESTQSFHVAREFWTGAITTAQFADADDRSPFLADDTTVNLALADGFTVPSPHDGLSIVESVAAECSRGRRLMVHVPIWTLSQIRHNTSYLHIEGNLIVTDLGTIIVADAGYPGTPPVGVDPTPGESWIYATPIVQTYLDQVDLLPASLQDAQDLAAMVDWATNDAVVWAQRLAAYQLDPCCRFAIPTTAPLVTPPT